MLMLLSAIARRQAAVEVQLLHLRPVSACVSLITLFEPVNLTVAAAAQFPVKCCLASAVRRQHSTVSGSGSGASAAAYSAPQQPEECHAHGRSWTDPYR